MSSLRNPPSPSQPPYIYLQKNEIMKEKFIVNLTEKHNSFDYYKTIMVPRGLLQVYCALKVLQLHLLILGESQTGIT